MLSTSLIDLFGKLYIGNRKFWLRYKRWNLRLYSTLGYGKIIRYSRKLAINKFAINVEKMYRLYTFLAGELEKLRNKRKFAISVFVISEFYCIHVICICKATVVNFLVTIRNHLFKYYGQILMNSISKYYAQDISCLFDYWQPICWLMPQLLNCDRKILYPRLSRSYNLLQTDLFVVQETLIFNDVAGLHLSSM